ncbi:peptidase [Humibacter ginsenosidimutans]|uniref:Peptidase n=1 Tax=Humibacter ginsenosidimutans TaxID=2599293 RepID=A0A5B8M184_9MICO|nr:peptidase [Humibacter ginsenosidimutans]QDZ13472.1 peptidase [Humibacter ginsenosidimutans]
MIDWFAFFTVAVAALVSACVVVALYSLGLRMLSTAGKAPHVTPAEFTDAITIITPAEAAAEAKRIKKASARNPLTTAQKRLALVVAYTCFVLCGAVVLFGIYLIIPALHT